MPSLSRRPELPAHPLQTRGARGAAAVLLACLNSPLPACDQRQSLLLGHQKSSLIENWVRLSPPPVSCGKGRQSRLFSSRSLHCRLPAKTKPVPAALTQLGFEQKLEEVCQRLLRPVRQRAEGQGPKSHLSH